MPNMCTLSTTARVPNLALNLNRAPQMPSGPAFPRTAAPGTAASADICKQIQCGVLIADPQTVAQCNAAGYAGKRSCGDPVCDPWQDLMGCTPSPSIPSVIDRTYMPTNPSVIATAGITPAGNMPPFGPQTLLNPLPQIVPSPQPEPLPQVCNVVSAWVASNPFLAGALLVGAFALVTSKKGGR